MPDLLLCYLSGSLATLLLLAAISRHPNAPQAMRGIRPAFLVGSAVVLALLWLPMTVAFMLWPNSKWT